MLTLGQKPSIPVVSKVPTIILGIDVLYGSPKQSDVSSIAAVGSPDNVLPGAVIDNKLGQFMKFKGASETSLSHCGGTTRGAVSIP
ncbi:hypothetical protein J1N35_022919 [Gossypium stocksii]|uniref:Uncharacterized protein n=1 Tax=Gossypium stocksii TaxID=47602 RepID=A0A9D3VHK2_9ROSI|nr:hypothetical protein J1N35_022919 [Gossypium stocksii]